MQTKNQFGLNRNGARKKKNIRNNLDKKNNLALIETEQEKRKI